MSVRNVYVHVDSSNRLKTDQYGSIRVHMPHGLENARKDPARIVMEPPKFLTSKPYFLNPNHNKITGFHSSTPNDES